MGRAESLGSIELRRWMGQTIGLWRQKSWQNVGWQRCCSGKSDYYQTRWWICREKGDSNQIRISFSAIGTSKDGWDQINWRDLHKWYIWRRRCLVKCSPRPAQGCSSRCTSYIDPSSSSFSPIGKWARQSPFLHRAPQWRPRPADRSRRRNRHRPLRGHFGQPRWLSW